MYRYIRITLPIMYKVNSYNNRSLLNIVGCYTYVHPVTTYLTEKIYFFEDKMYYQLIAILTNELESCMNT